MTFRHFKPVLAATLAVGLYALFTSPLPEAAVSRVKTWGNETLTAADLNGEFDNILNNGEDLGWPATKAKDLNGSELILDADADSSITADTDDRIDFRAGGQDIVRFDGTTASSVNFFDLASRATGVAPVLKSRGEANVGMVLQDSNGNEALILGATASAVNEVTISNAATTNAPSISATGETNVDLNLVPKGTGHVQHSGVDIGGLGTVQTFTASGTYTKPAGLRFAIVELVGGGGGGGGVSAAGTTGAGGGAGGGYARELLAASAIGATETVTIGAGGAGGANTGAAGAAGGTTSFGALLDATGGTAGDGSTGTGVRQGGEGGVGSGGTFNIKGGGGSAGISASSYPGTGGSSHLGGGGRGFQGAGQTGGDYGGGGSGAAGTGAAFTGGAGTDGIVIVWEYY